MRGDIPRYMDPRYMDHRLTTTADHDGLGHPRVAVVRTLGVVRGVTVHELCEEAQATT